MLLDFCDISPIGAKLVYHSEGKCRSWGLLKDEKFLGTLWF